MTKGFIRYILFLLIVVMLMIMYDSYALFAVLAVFAAEPVTALIVWGLASRRVEVNVSFDRGVVQKGEKIALTFETNNRSILPILGMSVQYQLFNGYCGNGSEEELELHCAPKSSDKAVITIDSEFCGDIRAELGRVYVYDVFRIFRFKVRKSAGAVVSVLPEARAEGELPARIRTFEKREGTSYSEHKSGDDVSEIFDIREYRPGDSFKRVHRNLSNKMDTLLVKELGLPLDRELKIFADFSKRATVRETLESFDAIVCDFVRMGEALIRAGIPFFAIWHDTPGGCVKKEHIDSRDALFDVLSMMYKNTPPQPGPGIVREYEAAYPYEDRDETPVFAGREIKEEGNTA